MACLCRILLNFAEERFGVDLTEKWKQDQQKSPENYHSLGHHDSVRSLQEGNAAYYEDPLEDEAHSVVSRARIAGATYRSVEVTIQNKTNLHLEYVQTECYDGKWTAPPAHEIPSMRGITFNSIATRPLGKTSGYIVFQARRRIDDKDHNSEKFSFRWENGVLCGCDFARRSDSPEYVILVHILEGYNAEITFVIKNALRPNIPEKWELDAIKRRTYFSLQELRLIWRSFNEISDGYKEINKAAFVNAFPEFNNELILRSLFSAFAEFESHGDTINFNEFASVLSIMTRGNPREQVELAFNICDVDKSGKLERAEAEVVAKHFSNILNGLGYDAEMYGAPEEVLDNLFQTQHSDLRLFSKPLSSAAKGHKVHTLKEGVRQVGARFLRDLRETTSSERTSTNQGSGKSSGSQKKDELPVPSLGRGPNTNSPKGPRTPRINADISPTMIPKQAKLDMRDSLSKTPKMMNDYGSTGSRTPNFPKTPLLPPKTPNLNAKPRAMRASMTASTAGRQFGSGKQAQTYNPNQKNLKMLQSKWRRTVAVQTGASRSGARELELIVDGLTKEEVLERAAEDSDFVHCFGLFTYFYKRVLEPIEHEMAGEIEVYAQYSPERKGWLMKEKGEDILSKIVQHLGGGLDLRWFVIRDGFLAYYRSEKDITPVNVVSLQGAVVRESGGKESGQFYLKGPNWSRMLYADNRMERKAWVHILRSNIKGVYRFKSFAPIRRECTAKWYIGGAEYYNDLYDQLLEAKERIFIADWFFSPQLYLKRGDPLRAEHRLDYILRKKADEGVMIFVLIWNASQLAFDLRSEFVCEFMNRLHHKNITCISHPNWYPMTWSHHQKFVVVDDEVAFVGGIDLCYNRYDDNRYLLTDITGRNFPGKDYGNLCILTESNGTISEPSSLDRNRQPRMPWHDIHMRVVGDAAKDVATNFIQRWNHAIATGSEVATTVNNQSQTPADTTLLVTMTNNAGGIQLKTKPITSTEIYANDKTSSMPNLVRNRAPAIFLLPKNELRDDNWVDHWHRNRRNSSAALNVSNGVTSPVSRLNEGTEYNKPGTKLSGEYRCTVQVMRSAGVWSAGLAFTERSIYKAYLTAIREAKHFIYIENQYFISSINKMRPKNKILKTLHKRLRLAIANLEQFRVIVVIPVYPAGSLVDIATRYVIKYVYKTIGRQGHSIIEKLKQEFPEVDVSQYISFYALRNHNLNELDQATLDKLAEAAANGEDDQDDREDQIREAHGSNLSLPSQDLEEAQNKVWTEQIYIHAKLMIVDDRIAIIGSANINDRSMRGSRDSEICTYIESEPHDMVDSIMGGAPFKVSPFAHELRMRLWRDYLDVPEEEADYLRDAVSQKSFNTWQGTAKSNTDIYMKVFPDIPDHVRSLSAMSKDSRPRHCLELKKVKGFLIEFPEFFLLDEQMSPTIWNKDLCSLLSVSDDEKLLVQLPASVKCAMVTPMSEDSPEDRHRNKPFILFLVIAVLLVCLWILGNRVPYCSIKEDDNSEHSWHLSGGSWLRMNTEEQRKLQDLAASLRSSIIVAEFWKSVALTGTPEDGEKAKDKPYLVDWSDFLEHVIMDKTSTEGAVLELGIHPTSSMNVHKITDEQKRTLVTVESNEKMFKHWTKKLEHVKYIETFSDSGECPKIEDREEEDDNDDDDDDDHGKKCSISDVTLWNNVGRDRMWSIVFVNHGMFEQRPSDITRLRTQTNLFVLSDSDPIVWHKQKPKQSHKRDERREDDADREHRVREKEEKGDEKEGKKEEKGKKAGGHKAANASKYGKRPDDSVHVRQTRMREILYSFKYSKTVEDKESGRWYTLLSDLKQIADRWS
ncbi:phospholipase D, Pi-PXPH-PLD [Planoprotostelium fungivorum]|uniref:phospholipase D n=1 Tax=Planoprotostelium fungivorum TaxID=1890364 RepID=A0A2P6NCH4_9EUKA|nr:phospholipase D, Pi-PXPH-PLD [Planoprotostelium fungivorum]